MRGIIIEVEKIQRYVYHRIDERRAEFQQDSKTLQEIVFSSNAVSEDILRKIKERFEVNEKDSNKVLLWISGKVIFVSDLEQKEINQKLKELHKDIYLEFGGSIQLSYASFSVEVMDDKMAVIQLAKSALEIAKQNNTNLLDISEELFRFQELKKKPMKQGVSYSDGIFARDMDALVINNSTKENGSTNGKIAVVKADINNMGKIFSEIKEYSQYKDLSDLLAGKISMDYFRILVENYRSSDLKGKIFPLYIEGDDVFFAVQIDVLLSSIDILHKMIKEMNEEIKTKIQSEINLGIAVGVIFTNNHQPIRYYREMVEKELGSIKEKMKIEKADRVDLGVSLAGNSFYSYRGILGTSERDGFSGFSQEIRELKWLRSQKIFSDSFVFNLLRTLEATEKDPEKQVRHLLYFVLPDTPKTDKSIYDLLFKYYLLSQVVEDKKESKYKKPGKRLFDAKKINSILIPKLKLILLLTDDRFVTLEGNRECKFKSIIREKDYSGQVENIIRVMFTKPLNYLIERYCPKEGKKGIETVFISRENPRIDGGSITVYKRVPLQVAMLFRMKGFMEQKKYNLVEKVVINYFEQNKEDFEKAKKDRKEEGKKVEYRKDFDSTEFERLFKEIVKESSENPKTDWLDNLILFYKYDEQRMKKEETKKSLLEFKNNIKFLWRRKGMNKIEYSIKTVSNCLIGNQTESFSIGGVDQATTVDEKGYPMIHGSSMKGALRNMVREQDDTMEKTKELMEYILKDIRQKYEGLDPKTKELDAIQKVIKKLEEIGGKPVKAEYIFGIEGINNTPRVFFSDLKIIGENQKQNYFLIDTKNVLEEKDGEILSRPRTYKVLKPGIKLKGHIRFQGFEKYSELLDEVLVEFKKLLLLFEDGMYGLGNSKSRGYGRIEILEENIVLK